MPKRLLDRQISLLEYLTSARAIFGERSNASGYSAVLGIDQRLLHLEARFSHEKRMDKIRGVFARTFEILADRQDEIVREFVDAFPSSDISRFKNARQFHDFLSSCWRRDPPQPPHLLDVAACELACAKVIGSAEQPVLEPEVQSELLRGSVRRPPAVVLLRCNYDVRAIFEDGLIEAAPLKRDTWLAVGLPPGADQPRIFELPAVIFGLLMALDTWTDPVVFEEIPEVGQLIANLGENGLLEVRS